MYSSTTLVRQKAWSDILIFVCLIEVLEGETFRLILSFEYSTVLVCGGQEPFGYDGYLSFKDETERTE